MGHSARLRSKIDLVSQPRSQAAAAFWSHPRLADFYPDFLLMQYSVICTAVPLMEAALQRSHSLAESDPVAFKLAVYLDKHIQEESGEDLWVLDDLEVLGVARGGVPERIPSTLVAELTGSQYYWIAHHHPVALLGYVYALEGYPPSTQDVERMIERTGLPRAAFRTLRKHATADIAHRKDLEKAIDSLPLTDWQSALLGISAWRSVHLVAACMRDLLSTCERRIAVPA